MGFILTAPLCECLDQPLRFDRYKVVKQIGIDPTNGRFGEVAVWQCKNCGRRWLRYFVEYEGFSQSGRYYLGLIDRETAEALSPEEAVAYLNSLDWHLYGGSYFGRTGKSGTPVNADF